MSYDKKKLAKYLSDLFTGATDDTDLIEQNKNKPYEILGGAGSRIEIRPDYGKPIIGNLPDDGPPSLVILESGLRAKCAFVDECLKDRDFALRVGEVAIKKHLNQVLQNSFGIDRSTCNWDDFVKSNVLQPLRCSIKSWQVLVPISNLRIAESLRVGNVDFVRHEQGVVSNTSLIIGHKGPPDPEREMQEKAGLLKVINEVAQQGTAWAITRIDSHESRIREVAREQIEAAISVVRAFTHAIYPQSMRAAFGFPNETSSGMSGFIATTETGLSIQFDRRGFFIPFELNSEIIQKLKNDLFFDRLSQIAGASWDSINSLERAIRVACLWISRSVIAATLAEALTHCVIALERLLIVDSEEATTERFADRLALLLADNMEVRKQIHLTAKRIYDIRSKVVHTGFDGVADSQCHEVAWLAINALVKVTSMLDKFNSHESLRSHLHDLKLT